MDTKELREYAWNWFEYHAGQRLTTFHFFLILLGGLVVAFSTGLKDGNEFFAFVVGWFGAFISLAFLILEFRNEHLVNVGREALVHLEQMDESLKDLPKLQLAHNERGHSHWVSYKYSLKAIYVVCLALFVIGATNPALVHTAKQDTGDNRNAVHIRGK